MPAVKITRLSLPFSVESSLGRSNGGGVWLRSMRMDMGWDMGCRCFSRRREYVAGGSHGRNCCSKIVFGGAGVVTAGGTGLVVHSCSSGSLSENRSKTITVVMTSVGDCKGRKCGRKEGRGIRKRKGGVEVKERKRKRKWKRAN